MSNSDDDSIPDNVEVIIGNYTTRFTQNGITINRRNNYCLPTIPLAGIAYTIAQLKNFGSRSKFIALGIWSTATIFNSIITMNNDHTVFNIKKLDTK